jgi:hypothetical protein
MATSVWKLAEAKPTPQGGVKEGVPRSEAVAMTL